MLLSRNSPVALKPVDERFTATCSDHAFAYGSPTRRADKKAKISAEMHIYSEGGHGYGLRRTEIPVTSWNDRMEDWLRLKGFLEAF